MGHDHGHQHRSAAFAHRRALAWTLAATLVVFVVQVAAGWLSASAHVVVTPETFTGGHTRELLERLHACLTGCFTIDRGTFQLEPPGLTELPTHA